MEDNNKRQHGGSRRGAGRPRTGEQKKYPTGVRLPLDLYTFLKMQKNKSVFIEEVMRFYIKEKGITL